MQIKFLQTSAFALALGLTLIVGISGGANAIGPKGECIKTCLSDGENSCLKTVGLILMKPFILKMYKTECKSPIPANRENVCGAACELLHTN
jgi:hypothetical protein